MYDADAMLMSPLLGRVDLPLDQYRNLAPAQIDWSDELSDTFSQHFARFILTYKNTCVLHSMCHLFFSNHSLSFSCRTLRLTTVLSFSFRTGTR